jgi:hypothetical protein
MKKLEIDFIREDCDLLKQIKSDIDFYKEQQDKLVKNGLLATSHIRPRTFQEMFGYSILERLPE